MRKGTIAALISAALLLTGCTGNTEEKNDKLKIVTTIFPQYDFAREIGGDNVEVSMLLKPGMESHDYEPTAQDIVRLQNADLFIYVGGESDEWVEKVLSSFDKDIETLTLMECVNAVEEKLLPGMEEEEHHHEDEEHNEEEEHDHEDEHEETEYDEHVWTSPENCVKIAEKLAQALCKLDPEGTNVYEANSKSYIEQLNGLDKDFESMFSAAKSKTLVFGDRFPFRYFADSYELDCYAAFPGCSSESEPSAATLAYLTEKVRNEGISTVFYIEFSTHNIADTIAAETGAKTAMLHTCHNVTQAELDAGATYISIMRNNLETLRGALN